MKKKLFTLIAIFGIILIPFQTKAAETSMNLEETLKDAGITFDLSNYKESDEQTTIYLFRGSSCGYCHKFLEFLNSILPEYGKYFKVKSYEVWQNTDNAKLMKKIANFLDETANGVPFIVIGDKVFTGYSNTFDDQIKKAIVEEFNNKNGNDVLKAIEKADKEKNKSSVGSATVIIWNFIFVGIGTGIVLLYVNNKVNTTNHKVEEVKVFLEKTMKSNKTEEKGTTKKKQKK